MDRSGDPRGKEQMCPNCGRWEAAHRYCSWCFRPMTEADWYRNGDATERQSRMPKEAPADPPLEYIHSANHWPKTWGPYPRQRRASAGGTPVNAEIESQADSHTTAGGTQ